MQELFEEAKFGATGRKSQRINFIFGGEMRKPAEKWASLENRISTSGAISNSRLPGRKLSRHKGTNVSPILETSLNHNFFFVKKLPPQPSPHKISNNHLPHPISTTPSTSALKLPNRNIQRRLSTIAMTRKRPIPHAANPYMPALSFSPESHALAFNTLWFCNHRLCGPISESADPTVEFRGWRWSFIIWETGY